MVPPTTPARSVSEADLQALLDHRLLFVTGKGGVGKTSLSAALARLAAQQGKRVLLGDLDGRGDLANAFESGPLSFEPTKVANNIWAMSMDTEASMREYIKLNLKIPMVGGVGPVASAFDFLASAAPGVREILTIGKYCYEVREQHYDLVIVDSTASGHIISHLGAPDALRELIRVGPLLDQTSWMNKILHDGDITGVVMVAIPEEMPATETIELRDRLENETSISRAAVIINRVLPELFSTAEEEVFDRIITGKQRAALVDHAGETVEAVLAGATFASNLRRSRTQHIERLFAEFAGADDTVVVVPQLFVRTEGLRVTKLLATALSEEL